MAKFGLLQVDDFAPDWEDIRNKVIEGEFKTEIGPEGAPYENISKYPVDHWYSLIEEVTHHKIVPRMSFFRQDMEDKLPHNFVHSDEYCSDYAVVLYMNKQEQCRGGTAFWQHLQTGLEYQPTNKELEARGIDPIKFGQAMMDAWQDPYQWTQTTFIPMKPNRLITYPTSRIHSRWPWKGFGTNHKDGRLIWCLFYDFA